MHALLKDALLPNLVQTVEGGAALVHGGPFANIAHGCSSIVATQLALRTADEVVTEAGFGFDLGGEKFLDIACRAGGFWPHALVLVATLRALKVHGGVKVADAAQPDLDALERGMDNVHRHIESARHFGLDPIVVVNLRAGDASDEVDFVLRRLREAGVDGAAADVFGRGGEGAIEAAEKIVARAREGRGGPAHAYDLVDAPMDKMDKIARLVYGARGVQVSAPAKKQLDRAVALGFGALPVCMAKTHLSLSDNAKLVGRPTGFDVNVREVRIAAGAGFLVALTGEITTMPGLPRHPHAADIDLGPDGAILGIR